MLGPEIKASFVRNSKPKGIGGNYQVGLSEVEKTSGALAGIKSVLSQFKPSRLEVAEEL